MGIVRSVPIVRMMLAFVLGPFVPEVQLAMVRGTATGNLLPVVIVGQIHRVRAFAWVIEHTHTP